MKKVQNERVGEKKEEGKKKERNYIKRERDIAALWSNSTLNYKYKKTTAEEGERCTK